MTAVPDPPDLPDLGPVGRKVLLLMIGFFLGFPHIDQWKESSWDPVRFFALESRHPAPKPGTITDWASLVAWTKGWDAYMTDRLGFRQQFLVFGQWVKWKLGLSTERVMWGKKDWAFLHTFFELNMPAYLRGTIDWDQEEVNALVRVMERRHDWLARQGIPMLVVIAPVKGSVYPEYLPGNIRSIAPTMRQRLLEAIDKSGSDLQVLDLLPDLLSAKSREALPLYYATDSHWNDIGGRVAYDSILQDLKHLFTDLEPIPRDALQSTPVPCIGLDLGVLSSLAVYMSDTRFDTTPAGDTHIQYAVVDGKREEPHPEFGFHLGHKDATLPVGVFTDRKNRPRVLVYRDSFASALSYYLNETFAEVHYRHHYGMQFDPQPVLDIQPDVVIYLFLERALLQFDSTRSLHRERAQLYPSGGIPVPAVE